MIFCDYGCSGILTVDEVPLNCPAWDAPLLTDLWMFFERRHQSTLIPHRQGQRPNPEFFDESTHDLPFFVTGEIDRTGTTPFADPWQGLQVNLAYLHTNVFVPVSTGRGTRSATITMPDMSTREADVQLELVRIKEINDPRFAEFSIRLTVPAGMFVTASP